MIDSKLINQIQNDIDTHLGIAIALFEIDTLSIVHRNDLFKTWFIDSAQESLISKVIPEANSDQLLKRLLKDKEYNREREIKDGYRNRTLRITFSKISKAVGLIRVQDHTKEKELEYMMDSYAKLAEKNKKELEAANARIQSQNERMLKELEIARQVQKGMLPFDFNPNNENVEFAALLKPALEVAGDFFDIFYIDSDNLCICLGDVSDKGAGAALFMAATKSLITSNAINSKSTASIVGRVNNELTKNNERCMFTTLFVGIFNLNNGSLLYSNCGHCFPILIRDNKSIKELKELNGPALGVTPDHPFSEQEIKMIPQQTLLIYSDGIIEAQNKNEELFSDKRLKDLIRSADTFGNPERIIHYVFDAVSEHEKDTQQSDDITIIALKYMPKQK